jgi:hypothetical protein
MVRTAHNIQIELKSKTLVIYLPSKHSILKSQTCLKFKNTQHFSYKTQNKMLIIATQP